MASDDIPAPGEIWRLLTKIDARLDRMTHEAQEREKLYVRTDVFDERQKTDAIQVRGLEGEVHSVSKRLDQIEERGRRMWVLLWTSLAAPLLIALVVAAVASRGA